MMLIDKTSPEALLKPDFILLQDQAEQEELIDSLIQGLNLTGMNPFLLKNDLLEREKLSSTSIGCNIALPHLKILGLDRFYLSIGILKEGIDWGGIDGGDVRLVLLILGPPCDPMDYLHYLSQLTRFVKTDKILEKLIASKTTAEAYKLFSVEG